jgi:UPF0755 protein
LRSLWRKAVAGLTLLLLIVAVIVTWQYRDFLSTPLNVGQATVFELPAGTSYGQMVRRLREMGYTRATWPWRVLGWRSGQTGQLKAGEYQLDPGMNPRDWLQRVVNGDVLLHGFTIIEGWTFAEMMAELRESPAILQTLESLTGIELMAAIGAPDQHPEGWFLPETYRFPRGTSDRDVLQRAHQAMVDQLAVIWEQRELGLPLDSPYEALILASIIEKETGLSEERRQIAGVFTRRLQQKMRLQTDPTVIYGLGVTFDGDLRRRDLKADTPYNTYTRHGLPPTPIAMPGKASLQAAVSPEPGETLYFVARGDGSHVFSQSLEDHEAAVDRYQRAQGSNGE